MRFDIISANPKILESSLTNGLISRAVKKGLAEVKMHHLRDYAEGSYRQIDDIPYGGGTGMVLKPEPFFKCIKELTSERKYDSVIHFSPQGDLFNQKSANKFSLKENYILLCGHYKGIDQRVIDAFVTEEVSIGEYVISCGDIAALVFMDASLCCSHLPDSFSTCWNRLKSKKSAFNSATTAFTRLLVPVCTATLACLCHWKRFPPRPSPLPCGMKRSSPATNSALVWSSAGTFSGLTWPRQT